MSEIAGFDPDKLIKAKSAMETLASSPLLPEHLRGRKKNGQFTEYDRDTKIANMLLVADACAVFKCNFLMLAKSSFVVGGTLDFDGKVYAALANTSGFLAEELSYEYLGEKMDLRVIVRGRLKGESTPREAEMHITTALSAGGKDSTPEWQNNPKQQLAYAGARQWVRRHLSKALLGFSASAAHDEDFQSPPRMQVEVPTDDYKRASIELRQCQFRHQVQRVAESVAGRNRMTNDERNRIVADARDLWKQLPYSEDDPANPELLTVSADTIEKAGREHVESIEDDPPLVKRYRNQINSAKDDDTLVRLGGMIGADNDVTDDQADQLMAEIDRARVRLSMPKPAKA